MIIKRTLLYLGNVRFIMYQIRLILASASCFPGHAITFTTNSYYPRFEAPESFYEYSELDYTACPVI